MKKVLKASAGTGKTYRLSLEYIIALLRGERFDEILVMTFTKKATAEIKERILKFIEVILYTQKHNEDEKKYLEGLELINNIRALSGEKSIDFTLLEEAYKDILLNRDRVEIYTIDGFTNKAFKKFVTIKNSLFNYEIDDSSDIFEKVLEKLVSKKESFEKMRKFFENEKDRDVENYIDIIKFFVYNRWKYSLVKESGLFKKRDKKFGEDYFKEFEEFYKGIEEFGVKSSKGDKVWSVLGKSYCELTLVAEKKEWILKNSKSIFDKNLWNGNQTKGAKNANIKEHFEEIWEKVRESLAIEIYNSEICYYEENYFKMAKLIYETYDNLRFKEKIFSHGDISFYLIEELLKSGYIEDGKIESSFFEIYGNVIKTIFIDEFQDTSIVQWKILAPIVNYCENVIIVGDEKQSIYSWRGGEKRLFENLEEIIDADVETLNTSYRSTTEVIDFVNEYFGGFDNWSYEDVKSVKEDGYVEIKVSSDEKSISSLLDTIEERGEYRGVGVLARGNGELEDIAREMEVRKIPYTLDSKMSIVEYDALEAIYSLLKYICYEDYFSLVLFFRSELYELRGEEYLYLLEEREEVENYLRDKENKIFSDEIKKIFDFIKRVKNLPYRELSKVIIEESGVLEKFSSESENKNILNFYKLMGRFDSLNEFLMWVEEKDGSGELARVGIEDNSVVNLMTIHKSKGLEFDSEHFYWKNSKGGTDKGLKFFVKLSKDFTTVTDYIVLKVSDKRVMKYIDDSYFEESETVKEAEEKNALYVALTRAAKNLIIHYSEKKTSKNERVERLKSYVGGEKLESIVNGEYLKSLEVTQEKESRSLIVDGMFDYKKFYFEESIGCIDLEKHRKDGLAIHYFFEFIKYGEEEEIEFAKSQVNVKYGNMIGSGVSDIEIRVREFIKKRVDIFDKNWKVYNEFDVYDSVEERNYRLDRLMVDDEGKRAVIVDFKSSDDPEVNYKYKAQIEKYCKLVEKILEGYRVSGELVSV